MRLQLSHYYYCSTALVVFMVLLAPHVHSSFIRRMVGDKSYCQQKYDKCMGERDRMTSKTCEKRVLDKYGCPHTALKKRLGKGEQPEHHHVPKKPEPPKVHVAPIKEVKHVEKHDKDKHSKESKKHEKAAEKHEKGHEKAGEKHEKGHEKAGEKHEKGHEKAGEKHEKGHEKAGVKHEKGHEKVVEKHDKGHEKLGHAKHGVEKLLSWAHIHNRGKRQGHHNKRLIGKLLDQSSDSS